MIGGALSTRGLWLDPRTKILLLLLCILSAMMAPSLFYELGLVVLIGLLGICFGKWKYAWKGVLFPAGCCPALSSPLQRSANSSRR